MPVQKASQDEASWLANYTTGNTPVCADNVRVGHSDSGGPASLSLQGSSSCCSSNTTGSSSRRHRFTCCCQRVLISLLPAVSRSPDTSRLAHSGCTSWFAYWTDRIISARLDLGGSADQKHNHPLGMSDHGG